MAASNHADSGDSLSLKGFVVPHTAASLGDANLQQSKQPLKVWMNLDSVHVPGREHWFLLNVNSRSHSLYVIGRPSVCRLSVMFVRPTQAIEIFRNVSTLFGTLAIC